MASKKWNVAVTDLGGTSQLHALSVEADNWMSALRAGRARMGEDGGVPQGASCAVSPEGIVTILDPVLRRRFVLTQRPAADATADTVIASVRAPTAAAPQIAVTPQAVAAPQVAATPQAAVTSPEQPTGKRRKFQTVAFDTGGMVPGMPTATPTAIVGAATPAATTPAATTHATSTAPRDPLAAPAPVPTPEAAPPSPAAMQAAAWPAAAAPSAAAPPSESGGKRRKFQTVAFDASTMGAAKPEAVSTAPNVAPRVQIPVAAEPTQAAPSTKPTDGVSPPPGVQQPTPVPSAAPAPSLELLSQRNDDPTAQNPLTYRERSYCILGTAPLSRSAAESALRAELVRIESELAGAKRGKFVNLAVFDHRWHDRPLRPPIATLQWKDWKGAPEIAFPSPPPPEPARPASQPPPAAADDRLATAFEALQDLPFFSSAAEGLEFAVKLLNDLIPSEAVAACLYDINNDELRVVAASGPAAGERKTQAISLGGGLFGMAARGGDVALVVRDVKSHSAFDPGLDSAPGIDARTMLLRPLVHDGQLFGVLQLINRREATGYESGDINVVTYVAENLAGFVRQTRLRGKI